jgi:hypothetical protein
VRNCRDSKDDIGMVGCGRGREPFPFLSSLEAGMMTEPIPKTRGTKLSAPVNILLGKLKFPMLFRIHLGILYGVYQPKKTTRENNTM